ncbi:MAG: hypothetical protein K0R57_2673 [Paenibacillaceae bacterium]|nr:hypothetical protein [Paenibacillaceae bacterium]
MKRVSLLIVTAVLVLSIGLSAPPFSPQTAHASQLPAARLVTEAVYTPETYVWDATVGTDQLGRKLPTNREAGNPKENKVVGIFYFLASSTDYGPYNVEYISKKYPEALYNNSDPVWLKGPPLHWGESHYGYYWPDDPWVMRRHAQQLANAGVDFIVFDLTNTVTYDVEVTTMLEILQELSDQGAKVPKIVFYTNKQSGITMDFLYNRYYAPGAPARYPDLWFNWRGKPLIIGLQAEASAEVSDFFTVKESQWPTSPIKDDGFPWIDFTRELPMYTYNGQPEMMTASVAQNASLYFSDKAFFGIDGSWGRSYHDGQYDDTPGAVNYGYNFAEQWEQVLDKDPPMVFITGWNEWSAGIVEKDANANFLDNCTEEYNRDIEPMKGGYMDNYYMQLAGYIRKFKGVAPMPEPGGEQTIAINSDFSQWANVFPAYKDYTGDTEARDYRGAGALYYTNHTGRNDIDVMKVARDADNMYFYVSAVSNLTPRTDPKWMRLFINSDNNPYTGWNGFDFVINRAAVGEHTTTLERSLGGWNWQTVSDSISYAMAGNELHLAIPRDLLGLSEDPVNLEFKWSDNMQNDGDMMDFYTHGDAAPDDRLRYAYYSDESSLPVVPEQEMPMPETVPDPEPEPVPGVARSWEFSHVGDLEGWQTQATEANLFQASANTSVVQVTYGTKAVAAGKFISASYFTALKLKAPGADSSSKLRLYKWDTDYETTLSGPPVGGWNKVDASYIYEVIVPQEPGEYLWTVSNPAQDLQVWKADGNYAGAAAYLNGQQVPGHYLLTLSDQNVAHFGVNEEQVLTGAVSNSASYIHMLREEPLTELTGNGTVEIRLKNSTSSSTAKLYFNSSLKKAEKVWEFQTGTEGWTASGHVNGFGWQEGGYTGGNITGVDPFIVSPDNLGVNITGNNIITIRMKNGTANKIGEIFFKTTGDTTWHSSRSKTFATIANDSGYSEYTIDMSTVPGWTGTLRQLRLDPNKDVASGSFSVDGITIGKAETKAWKFGLNTEGWSGNGHVSGFGWQTGGYAGGSITGIDPFIMSPDNIGTDITGNKLVTVRMKNGTSSTIGQLYFTTAADSVWNGTKSKAFTIKANDEGYTEYTVDMSTVPGWNGTLKQLRLDPNKDVLSGSFSVDSIYIDRQWDEINSKTFTIIPHDSGYTTYTLDMSQVTGWNGTLKGLKLLPAIGAANGTFYMDYIRIREGSGQ